MIFEKVVALLLATPFIFFALVFSYIPFKLLLLRQRGVRALARVVRLEVHVDSEGGREYHPVVAFTLPDGTEVEAETDHEVSSAKPGSFIYVFYNPCEPTTATAEKGLIKELLAYTSVAAVLWYMVSIFARL